MAAVLVAFNGCGTGGGSGPGGSSLIQGRAVNVYVTDRFSDSYSQVLITLYKIEGTADGQTYQALYENSSGQTIDLTSLSNAAQLLSTVQVPGNATFTLAT